MAKAPAAAAADPTPAADPVAPAADPAPAAAPAAAPDPAPNPAPAPEPAKPAAAPTKPAADPASDQPVAYKDFTLPEGVQIDKAALAQVAPLFAKNKLSQEGAQELIDLYVAQAQARDKAWNDTKTAWGSDLKKWATSQDNTEFTGRDHQGDGLKEMQSLAGKAIDAYGGKDAPAIREFMKAMALGDKPELARFLARVGRTVREDQLVRSNGDGRGPPDARQMFPHSNMNP